jgi:hypothetical protein
MTTLTQVEIARARFRPGTAVEVAPDVLAKMQSDKWSLDAVAGVVFRTVEVVAFRDSDDDPIVCVCSPSVSGAHAAWFHPDHLRVVPP